MRAMVAPTPAYKPSKMPTSCSPKSNRKWAQWAPYHQLQARRQRRSFLLQSTDGSLAVGSSVQLDGKGAYGYFGPGPVWTQLCYLESRRPNLTVFMVRQDTTEFVHLSALSSDTDGTS